MNLNRTWNNKVLETVLRSIFSWFQVWKGWWASWI